MPLLIAFALNISLISLASIRRLIFTCGAITIPPPEHYRPRYLHVDVGRGLAILAVIIIHLTLILSAHLSHYDSQLNIIGSLCRFAVPFFLIFSAATLHYDPTRTTEFFLPKMKRIAIPYALTVLGYCCFIGIPLVKAPKLILTGEAAPQFYFIPLLFQLYVITPFLVRFTGRRYLVAITLILSILFFYLLRVHTIYGVTNFLCYIFYFAYGMCHAERIKNGTPLLDLKYCFCIVLLYAIIFSLFPGRYGNDQFIFAIVALEIFLTIKQRIPIQTTLGLLGRYSLWIFLFHWWALKWFESLAFG